MADAHPQSANDDELLGLSPGREGWTYAPVPLWLLMRVGVSNGAKLLYARLMLYAGKNGKAFPRQVTLGADLGVSDRQVRRLLKELEALSLVKARRRGVGRSDEYTFQIHPWQSEPLHRQTNMQTHKRRSRL